MNAQLFLNNFDSQFIAAVKSTPTTGSPASELDYGIVRLPQSAGAILGTLTNGDYYILTAFKRSGSNETAVEIMKVTNVDTSVINETRLIVLRGQEGTSPQAYISGDYISLRETAGGLSGMLQKSGNLAGLANPAAARANLGAAPLASPVLTGTVSVETLNFSGVARRITGDFSNVTVTNRTAFQSSVTNGSTLVPFLPNGTAQDVSLTLYNGTDPLNAQRGYFGMSGSRVFTGSNYSGTPGVALPFDIDVGGASRQRILPTGEVGIGVTPAIGQGTLQVQNVNGAAASGFKNKINNGCCRISRKGSGAAALGWNSFGADGISTYIGGWSAVTGNIVSQSSADSSRTSSGGTHVTNITAATGGAGYINHIVRIEAADALELAGKTVTTSMRITSLTKQIDEVAIYINKANAVNSFGAVTLVASGAGLGPVSANTTKDVSFSTTLTTADCANGLQIELHCLYTSAVTEAFHCVIADLQCCAGSQRMPFELRPIAIEEQLRERYWKVLQVWVPTSSSRAVVNIRMHKTPTISGGGTGLVSTGTDKDNLVCYQTTAALQTITLNAEL